MAGKLTNENGLRAIKWDVLLQARMPCFLGCPSGHQIKKEAFRRYIRGWSRKGLEDLSGSLIDSNWADFKS